MARSDRTSITISNAVANRSAAKGATPHLAEMTAFMARPSFSFCLLVIVRLASIRDPTADLDRRPSRPAPVRAVLPARRPRLLPRQAPPAVVPALPAQDRPDDGQGAVA